VFAGLGFRRVEMLLESLEFSTPGTIGVFREERNLEE
jgi:hypothetical protein